jgi:uncharacterized membrane protein
MAPPSPSTVAPLPRLPVGAALLLGVALGGFIDGILLHQVLQWHHLLSNVDAVRDLRTQILADGVFHLLMYALAIGALVRLARARATLGAPGAGQRLLVWTLVGFSLWQAIDVVGFHWAVGIHRVRLDVPDPLVWDIGWLVVFGVPPLLVAASLARRGRQGRGGAPGGRGTAVALTALAIGAGAWSAWPVPAQAADGSREAVVLFAPGMRPAAAFDALAAVDARVRWVDRSGTVWAVRLPPGVGASALQARGAWLVGGTPVALGCVAFARP